MYKEPLEIKTLPQRALDVTRENQYWDSFQLTSSKTQFGQVKSIHICPTAPHEIAVACLDQVAVYDALTYDLVFRDMHFKDGVNCCQFRADGQLLTAAGNDPVIRVWARKVSLVRLLRGHTAAIHQTAFLPNNIHVFSCSDDMTAKIWDLATQESIATMKGHSDYVRAGASHPTNHHLLATGSYDKLVRVWDTRVDGGKSVLQLRHREPVEALAWHPSGNFVASTAGNTVSVWDVVSGRAEQLNDTPPLPQEDDIFGSVGQCGDVKPVFSACNHQRAIPTLTYNPSGSRLLTGGLDEFVKIYNTTTYTVVHSIPFSASVQAIALSPDERNLVVGMVDGKVAIHSRPLGAKGSAPKDELFEHHGGYLFKPKPKPNWQRVIGTAPSEQDLRIEKQRQKRLKKYDHNLGKFRYHKALDTVLANYKENKEKESQEARLVVITMLEELYRRNGLRIALHGRTDVQLRPLLLFISETILDPRYTTVLSSVIEVTMEIYAGVLTQSALCDTILTAILKRLKLHLRSLREMTLVDGMLDCIMNASAAQVAQRVHIQESATPILSQA